MYLRFQDLVRAVRGTALLAALFLSAAVRAAAPAEAPTGTEPPAPDTAATPGPDTSTQAGVEGTTEGTASAEAKAVPAEAAPPPKPVAAPPAPPEAAPPPAKPEDDRAFAVVRLPPEAYPEPQTRGIPGSSLWLTFHGMQWPYMPTKPGGPELVLGLSGWVWVDTGYETIRRGTADRPLYKYLLQQGRFVLRATPTWSRGPWFVQGQVELIGNADQTVTRSAAPDTDDLWIRVGRWNAFDVQVGRYEAWEIYHLGMGLDLNTLERRGAPTENDVPTSIDFYGVTDLYYRPSGPGNVALHLYPFKFLRFEFLGQLGHVSPNNSIGGRWAAILDFGWVKLKGGTEIQRQTNRNPNAPALRESKGGGGALQFVINPYADFGVNVARGLVDVVDARGNVDEAGSVTRTSLGGFANVRIIEDLLIGGGITYTDVEDLHLDRTTGRVGEFYHLQTYGALQYKLFQQLYLKAVVGYAQAHFEPTFTETPPYNNDMYSGRLRASYYF